jgi:hypothetical protein
MKIGDVKVGDVLALDASERYARNLPRKVEVLQVVTVEETYWQSRGFHSARATRKVRRVEVKFLDLPTGETSRYAKYDYAAEKQGAKRVVEAKSLIAPWDKVSKDVEQRIEKTHRQATNKAAAEARLEALFGKKLEKLHLYVTTAWDDSAEVRLEGTELDTILTLAERGKKAVE